MAIDTTTPRSRRAVIAGAVGGALASIGLLAKAPEVRAGVDGDLVLETTNNTDTLTELVAANATALRVVSNGVGLQAWGNIAVDALGDIAVNAISDGTSAPASIGFNRGNSVGVLGWSANGNQSSPTLPAKTGVLGLAQQDSSARGVYGKTTSGQGVRGEATTGDGLWAEATTGRGVVARSTGGSAVDAQSTNGRGAYGGSTNSAGVHGHGGGGPAFPNPPSATGVYATANGSSPAVNAWSESGNGVLAQSTNGLALTAIGQTGGAVGQSLGTKAGVAGLSGNFSPTIPDNTGVYGEAHQPGAHGVFGKAPSGEGVRGESTDGTGVVGESSGGTGVEGRGETGVAGVSGSAALPAIPSTAGVQGFGGIGVAGTSSSAVGVFGKSGSGSPQLLALTGVHGYAAQDANAQGVFGETTIGVGAIGRATSGQGVRGEATTGVGVKAVATSGVALDIAGRAVFSRSGRVNVPAKATYVDVTVPGGLAGSPLVLAVLQLYRPGVSVMAARPNWPTSGVVRIYLNAVASTTVSTPLAWFVLG